MRGELILHKAFDEGLVAICLGDIDEIDQHLGGLCSKLKVFELLPEGEAYLADDRLGDPMMELSIENGQHSPQLPYICQPLFLRLT